MSSERDAPPAVSVIVINKDDPGIAATVAALVAHRSAHDIEILVVDASRGRFSAVRDAHPGVRWIDVAPVPGRVTIPEQRNAGVRRSRAPIVVFTDASCLPDEGWLDALVAPLVAGEESATVGSWGSWTDGSLAAPRVLEQGYATECPTINVAFTRAAFDAVGGFDESFDYGSDVDFCWRLAEHGVRVRFVPESVVRHDWGDARSGVRRAMRYGAARARLYGKHPGRLRAGWRRDRVPFQYAALLLVLPLSVRRRWRWLPLLLLVPVWRQRRDRPALTLAANIASGAGVLRHCATALPRSVRRRATTALPRSVRRLATTSRTRAAPLAGRVALYRHWIVRNPAMALQHLVLDVALWRHWRRVPVLPVKLDIEPVNACNYRCEHCQVTHWQKKRVDLDLAGLRDVLRHFPRLMEVTLQGMGEPFLNTEVTDLLDELHARGIATDITTNGSVMTPRIMAAIRRTWTSVTFSLDGATPATFEAIRVRSSLSRVVANMRALVESLQDGQRPEGFVVDARMVVTERNLHEVADVVDLATDVGLDRVTAHLVLVSWGRKDVAEANEPNQIRPGERLERALSDAARTAERRHLPFVVSRERFTAQRPCRWPWTRPFISSAGEVTPCCVLSDADTAVMGRLAEQDMRAIWNSPAYRELRDRLARHDVPDPCRDCYADLDTPGRPSRIDDLTGRLT